MKRPSVIITRPEQDAVPLARQLEAAGYRVLIEPVLHIETHKAARPELQEILAKPLQAVLITSKHAVEALKELSGARDFRLITIGHATHAAALQNGFTKVEVAEGDAVSLMDYVRNHCSPHKGKLLYAAGHDITAHIDEILAAEGFETKKIILYTAHASKNISPAIMQALRQKEVGAVLFFSQRSAEIFSNLLADESNLLQHLQALCLSSGVASVLSQDAWKSIHSAKNYSTTAIVELLKEKVSR